MKKQDTEYMLCRLLNKKVEQVNIHTMFIFAKKLMNTKQKLLKIVIAYKEREEQNGRKRDERNSCECTYNIILICESCICFL